MAGVRLTTHETLSLTAVASPVTTLALLQANGTGSVLVTSSANIRFTVDGTTTPVITGAAEVGALLGPTGDIGAIIITPNEFLNFKGTSVSGTARVQFEFLEESRFRMT